MAQGTPAIGTYEGTGSAVTLLLGFVPSYIRVVNVEDADATWEWFGPQGGVAVSAAGTAIKTAAAVATLSADGITALEGTSGAGVTLGTDLSESGKTHAYIAFR